MATSGDAGKYQRGGWPAMWWFSRRDRAPGTTGTIETRVAFRNDFTTAGENLRAIYL